MCRGGDLGARNQPADNQEMKTPVRELLKHKVSEQAFAECWPNQAPPFDLFLEVASEKLSGEVTPPIAGFTASVRSYGENRIRIDGQLSDSSGNKTYYLELVWLPRLQSFRGNAKVYNTIPAPKPKSIEQFIAALDAIADDDELEFEGQVYAVVEGLDESDENLKCAFTAIFDLFERLPEEDFGTPGALVHLLEARGGYKDLLKDSIHRRPSIPTVTMVNRLLNSSLTTDERDGWLDSLLEIVGSSSSADSVKDLAKHYLAYQSSRKGVG